MIRVACEMGKLGLGGLKRDGRVSFGFRTTSFDFCIEENEGFTMIGVLAKWGN